MRSPELPFETGGAAIETRLDARDREGRARAVDPRFNVALEASAGTGKTRVLVDRYVNLLKAGVDPGNVLAVTFTRKAAAEIRERVITSIRTAGERGELPSSRWRELRDRMGDISVSTIDAFCLSLLREFPLEANLDPGFALADETDVPRLVDESLDRALRTCRHLAATDEHVALVFAQLDDRRARRGLAALLNRRLIASDVLRRFLARGSAGLTVATALERAARALVASLESARGGLDGFIATGPLHPSFYVLARSLADLRETIEGGGVLDAGRVQATLTRAQEYVLTSAGEPRTRQLAHKKALFATDANWRIHRSIVFDVGGDIVRLSKAFKHDLNVLVARGTWRMYQIAEREYRRTLAAHVVLDFSDVLLHAIELLRQMEEFAQSRFRLESRYHHLLVDEFQDTSRPQWELLSLLVQAWGAGVGAAYEGPLPPSIFIVGDRKQSIYGFRDADVSLLQDAARHLEALRPDGDVRRSISRSFRSVPPILSFVNDVCHDIDKVEGRPDSFVYDEQDRFPVQTAPPLDVSLGLVIGSTLPEAADAVASEIGRLIETGVVVRDRETGLHRPVTPEDVAILFRTRDTHREFERALERRAIPAHVHKGLGFFDADEVQDVRALLWHLADPVSDLRAAAFLRSRFVRLSDEGLRRLAPHVARACEPAAAAAAAGLADDDRATIAWAADASLRWRSLADRVPPAELLDQALHESAYALELRGPRFEQARENLKKIRALVRRLQNRGYATLARVSAHLDHVAAAGEANAPIEARHAVSLMTIHASKGLEFPVVFVVDLTRGTAGGRDPIRVFADSSSGDVSVSVGDFLSDADEDRTASEREETKRLLYVALTRARDRLYLGASLKDSQLQVARGSLAEILPPSLLDLLRTTQPGPVEWTGSSRLPHRFNRCAAAVESAPPAAPSPTGDVPARPVDRSDLTAPAPPETVQPDARVLLEADAVRSLKSERIVGLAVHRLLQRRGLRVWRDDEDWRRDVAGAVHRDDLIEVDDAGSVIEAAGRAFRRLCERDDVQAIYAAGTRFHEVPFSWIDHQNQPVRGRIDCVVQADDSRVHILEFKTGRPRPEHALQASLYRDAVRAMFPDAVVESHLIYA